jgi:hypothetical protein
VIEGWIQTFTGKRFRPLAAVAADVDVRDIAHALALKCRFNGHCRVFYSVAEHSVRVSRLLETEGRKLALWGLMHDAGEAYLADLGGPIKNVFHVHHAGIAGGVETFGEAEDRLLDVIAQALGFDPVDYSAVRTADLRMLMTEARDVMGGAIENWHVSELPIEERIEPWNWERAEAAFLERWRELRG